ncbi:MAG TPA: SAM-dependent methyltransferase [Methanobacterium sp.]|nr:SAM-dependent methyltransferase [Methanobacterium sp.]
MINVLDFVLPLILCLAVVISISILWPLTIGAAWSPSSQRVVNKILEMAEVDSQDILYDLGSGDGRIVAQAVRRYQATGLGIEADPLRVMWSRITLRMMGLNRKTRIIWGDIFNQDISHATVVTVFLWQRTNEKLKEKLQRELKPGTRVVSYIWTFSGWTPLAVDREDRVYLYVIGVSDV